MIVNYIVCQKVVSAMEKEKKKKGKVRNIGSTEAGFYFVLLLIKSDPLKTSLSSVGRSECLQITRC